MRLWAKNNKVLTENWRALQLLFSKYYSILILSWSLSLWWWWVVVGGGGGVPSDYFVSTQLCFVVEVAVDVGL